VCHTHTIPSLLVHHTPFLLEASVVHTPYPVAATCRGNGVCVCETNIMHATFSTASLGKCVAMVMCVAMVSLVSELFTFTNPAH